MNPAAKMAPAKKAAAKAAEAPADGFDDSNEEEAK
jgi:hypothetical protein